MENGQKTASFHTMVNPRRTLEERIVQLTGISDEMVAVSYTHLDVYKRQNERRRCYGIIGTVPEME